MTRGSGDATFCGLGKKKVIVQSRKEMLLGLVSCALVKQEKGKKKPVRNNKPVIQAQISTITTLLNLARVSLPDACDCILTSV